MNNYSQRGDISIYIALLMLILITTSAVFLTNLLAEQSHRVRDIVESEQAFSAANSGLEEALYARLKLQYDGDVTGSVDYKSNEQATYTAKSCIKPNSSGQDEVNATSDGKFRGSNRHLVSGSNNGC